MAWDREERNLHHKRKGERKAKFSFFFWHDMKKEPFLHLFLWDTPSLSPLPPAPHLIETRSGRVERLSIVSIGEEGGAGNVSMCVLWFTAGMWVIEGCRCQACVTVGNCYCGDTRPLGFKQSPVYSRPWIINTTKVAFLATWYDHVKFKSSNNSKTPLYL